jgi:hypothetical protein
MEFGAFINLDTDDIAQELSGQLTHEELIEFITTLDLYVADWSFTEELYKFFKQEHKHYKAEVKEFS